MTNEPPARPSYDVLQEGQELGKYRIRRRLGAGGMAIVYEAEHIDLGKRCAIKILNPEYAENGEVKARFLREGQAASRIGHKNVVDVYDVASSDDITYLVMEFLEGEDMGAFLEREGAIPESRVADLLIPVASALARAHELQIVHRDIKPDNIFLVRGKGTEVEPKVVDFGISKLIEVNKNDLTQTSAMLGTPMYMSPEQARAAKNVGFSTDQYSLGVIAYQAVTGCRPFESDTLYALLHSIVSGDFRPPSSQVSVHPRFEALILRAMQNTPEDRFASMEAFGAALLPFASERIRFLYQEDFQKGLAGGRTLNLPGSPSEVGSEMAPTFRHPDLSGSDSSPGGQRDQDPRNQVDRGDVAPGKADLTESARTVAAVSGDVGESSGRSGPEHQERGVRLGWVMAGLVVGVGVAGYLVLSREPSSARPEAPMQATAADVIARAPERDAEPPAPPAPVPEPPKRDPLRIESSVAGARLSVDGNDQGPLPLALELRGEEDSVELEVEAPGHLPKTLTWRAGDDTHVVFDLTPLPPPRPRPEASPAPRPPQPAPKPVRQPSAPLLAPR